MPELTRHRRDGVSLARRELIAMIGTEVARFQEESTAFDELAARILGLNRGDLPCMTLLLFTGPASIAQLTAALRQPRPAVSSTLGRLQLAGYVRTRPEGRVSAVELTEHAREWIERLWASISVGPRKPSSRAITRAPEPLEAAWRAAPTMTALAHRRR